jgi:hypothetical protein
MLHFRPYIGLLQTLTGHSGLKGTQLGLVQDCSLASLPWLRAMMPLPSLVHYLMFGQLTYLHLLPIPASTDSTFALVRG